MAYVFGGESPTPLTQIAGYDPATDSVTVQSAVLPSGRGATSAVADGLGNIYIFGGWNSGTGFTNEIVRYTPATQAITVMPTVLPTARDGTSAVWLAGSAYIFGGADGTGRKSDILQYTPATGTITLLATTLPTVRAETSAVLTAAGDVYIFGGYDGSNRYDTILRFTPSTGVLVQLPQVLPQQLTWTSAVWDGAGTGAAYVFGGQNGAGASVTTVVQFVPSTGTVTVVANMALPTRERTAAAWDGTTAYIFGGKDDATGTILPFIEAFTPGTGLSTVGVPGAPTALAAAPAASTSPTLSWTAPTTNGCSITGYRVYRSLTSGTYGAPIGTTAALSYNDAGLSTCTTYYYVVRAYGPQGESPSSNEPVHITNCPTSSTSTATTSTSTSTDQGHMAVGDSQEKPPEQPPMDDGTDPAIANADPDGDGVPARSDVCPQAADAGQEDLDGDGAGDACDDDIDGDGVVNTGDRCPLTRDALQLDHDQDGLGDACDRDPFGNGTAGDAAVCGGAAADGVQAADSAPQTSCVGATPGPLAASQEAEPAASYHGTTGGLPATAGREPQVWPLAAAVGFGALVVVVIVLAVRSRDP